MYVKALVAALALLLLTLAAVGCAPTEDQAADSTNSVATDTVTTAAPARDTLPTYERDTSEKDIPSETKFGEGELGKKEELSDVAP